MRTIRQLITALVVTTLLAAACSSPSRAWADDACPTVRYGDTGQAVTELQYRLKANGWTIAVDGKFGPRTEYVVRKLQLMSGLYVDGIVGPRTQAAVGCGKAAPTPTPAAATSLPVPSGSYAHPRADVERWHGLALASGWAESDWRWLSCVINRESKGQPGALANDSDDLSYGLTQLNTKGSLWSWFVKQGLTSRDQLHDPGTNLRVARTMFNEFGKRPWRSSTSSC